MALRPALVGLFSLLSVVAGCGDDDTPSNPLDAVFGDGDAAPGDGDTSMPVPMPGDGDMSMVPTGDGDMATPDAAMPGDDDAGMLDDGCDMLDPSAVDLAALNLAECGLEMCTNAHCVPGNLVDEAQQGRLATCTDGTFCVPDKLIAANGKFILDSCTSLGGAEGRCISTCVPQVLEQADRLPQDSCDDGELCAPCYDPITGEDTGSCSQSCDPGPAQPKTTFAECCGGLSVCVPTALVPSEQQGQLDAGDCSGSDVLCAPKTLAQDPDFTPKTCESLAGAEGRCLAACLPAVADRAASLPQDVCETGEVCAPCYDPFTGEATPACEIGDDMPVDPPVTFATCCDDGSGNDLGTCVPQSAVSDDQKPLLGADTCSDTGFLCAPTEVALGDYTPTGCTAVGDGEGRCLPACLPPVADRAGSLDVDVCADGLLCVPCYDPITGEDTGACRIEGDEPAEPATVFEGCCSDGAGMDLGVCVPSPLVPSEQVDLLGEDTCSDSSALCAPVDLAAGDYEPRTCTSWLDAEGRCLPACLPDVAAQASQLERDVCNTGELCVPCFSPLDGTQTGACALTDDMPADDTPKVFSECCDDGSGNNPLGRCVPSVLAGDQADILPEDECTEANYVCAPNIKIADQSATFPSCTTQRIADCGTLPNGATDFVCGLDELGLVDLSGQVGACVPICILELMTTGNANDPVEPALLYQQADCDMGSICAPCENPADGSSTGACE